MSVIVRRRRSGLKQVKAHEISVEITHIVNFELGHVGQSTVGSIYFPEAAGKIEKAP